MKADSLSLDKLNRKSPTEKRQEAGKHRRALIRGRQLIALGIVLLALFGMLTAAVLLLNPLVLDVPITREVQEVNLGPLDFLMRAVSAPGFWPWNGIFPVVIIVVLALFKRVVEAAFLALASIATSLAEVVKVLVHRGRPSADLVKVIGHPNTFSFPSGHVTQYVLFFGFSFYLAFTLMKPGVPRTLILAFSAAMVLLVGVSRIYMGQHWASDVLGGYTLGFGLLLLIIWGYRAWEERSVKRKT
ncbi:MAG: phosphatase PAP2 family protein [Chloroflexia bacterium]